MPKKQVAIMGATGAAGLEFIHTLQDHPWFEIVALYASERNRGKTLEEACRLSLEGVHQDIRNLQLRDVNDISASYDLICSALPSEVARDLEERCAVHTPVVSTTSAFRYEEDVPLIIPEINGETIEKVRQQQANRNWKGWVLPGPNCTTVGLVLSLAPLAQLRRIESVIMTSYQAVSGGGAELLDLWRTQGTMPQYRGDQAISPDTHIARGDPFFALNENVIGYISGEEQKVRKETAKILAHLQKGFKIDCSCVRVPVEVGHFETVFAETLEPISPEELVGFYETFNDLSFCFEFPGSHLSSLGGMQSLYLRSWWRLRRRYR